MQWNFFTNFFSSSLALTTSLGGVAKVLEIRRNISWHWIKTPKDLGTKDNYLHKCHQLDRSKDIVSKDRCYSFSSTTVWGEVARVLCHVHESGKLICIRRRFFLHPIPLSKYKEPLGWSGGQMMLYMQLSPIQLQTMQCGVS